MDFESPEQVAQAVRKFFPKIVEDASFKDFCNIGSLLTNEQLCLPLLAKLDEKMAEELWKEFDGHAKDPRLQAAIRAIKSSEPIAKLSQTQKDAIQQQKLETWKAQWLESNPPKFNGVLQKVLFPQEVKWGFNLRDSQPAPVPTLSGFVNPLSFAEYLFNPARHFKDPGASVAHGEYSHRLQWWIICSAFESGVLSLSVPPVRIFQTASHVTTDYWEPALAPVVKGMEEFQRQLWADQPALQESIPDATKAFTQRNMFDFLVDSVPNLPSFPERDTTPVSDSFRSPHYLNRYLQEPARFLTDPKLPVLHSYLVARNNKRTWQEVAKIVGGRSALIRQKWKMSEEQLEGFRGLVMPAYDTYGKIVEPPKK